MYPGILERQLFRFHPGKEDHIKTLLTQLSKQGRIRREADSSYYTSGTHFKPETPSTPDFLFRMLTISLMS